MKLKVLGIMLLFGIPSFFLGAKIWPPSPEMRLPVDVIPFFILLSLFESMIFGIGASFVVFGYPFVKRNIKSSNLAKLTYIAVSWSLVSWWPHDNLHAHNGTNAYGLLKIEYMFHLTLMISALIIAYGFFVSIKEKTR